MNIRKLKEKDAPFMLEWMHDKNVTKYLKKNFSEMQILNCLNFISYSLSDKNNLHLAVVNDNDEYMGTVSLKNINEVNAEFAITMRQIAQGHGYARYGMREIINYGFENLKVKEIYWNVLKDNIHAIHFYEKMGGIKISPSKYMLENTNLINDDNLDKYLWFKAIKNEELK